MTKTPAILDRDGLEIREGLMDAIWVTTLLAMHDLKKKGGIAQFGRGLGSMWSNPNCTGPRSRLLRMRYFTRVEDRAGAAGQLPFKTRHMDERASAHRFQKPWPSYPRSKSAVCFYQQPVSSTATATKIHTSMEGGPIGPKGEMRTRRGFSAMRIATVDIGLACGCSGAAQIGKGNVGHA